MDKVDVLGVKVSVTKRDEVLDEVLRLISCKKQIQITTPNPEQIILAIKDERLKKVINESDIAIPDGIGLVKVMQKKIKNNNNIERVTGVDLMENLLDLAEKKNFIVGLMGGQKEVAKKAIQRIRDRFPKLEIKLIPAHKDICKSTSEDEEIIKLINNEKINFLFVAYGAPWQELWIKNRLRFLETVKLAMGVGGAIDFWGGKFKRAPKIVQNLGLEWLFRLLQEPRRLKRQLKLVDFWMKTRKF